MFSKYKVLILVLIILAAVLLFVLPAMPAKEDPEENIKIMATTTLLYDMLLNIAPDNTQINYLMPPGTDPHTYQASAGDVGKLQNAHIVVYGGLNLEGKLGDVIANLESRNQMIICAGDGIDENALLFDEDHPGVHDPHIWFDAQLWSAAAQYTGEQLAKYLPEYELEIKVNTETYIRELKELDTYIQEKIAQLPENQRILVTAHDAFGYFGRAYGFEVKGLQGISTEAEAGTYDVSSLASFIAENQVKAIFTESSVPAKSIQALQAAVLSKGFEVILGEELYSDSLGAEGSGAETYIEMFKYNVDTIINSLNSEDYNEHVHE